MINSSLKQSFYGKYISYLMGALLLIGGTILGWWGYRFYLDRIEQAAFKDLAENIETFDKFIASNQPLEKSVERLNKLQSAFEAGTKKYSNSKLIPFFYLYKADTLIQKGDFSSALTALELAINKIEKDNPFYYLLLTKKALLQSDNDVSKEQGLKELNELALNKSNPFAAMSAYYLGLHYYHLNNGDKDTIAKAKSIWQAALDRQEHLTATKECSWCELIRAKLKNIL